MNRKRIRRVLLLFAVYSMLLDGMWTQSIADRARQEQEKKQQAASTPKIYTNDNIPHKGGLIIRAFSSPSPSSSASVSATPAAAQGKTSAEFFEPFYRPLLILGCALVLVGDIFMLVAAFRTTVWWGLGCLFVPLVQLFYLYTHWRAAKGPFFLQMLGAGLFFAVHMTAPGIRLLP